MKSIYYITNMFPSRKDNYGIFCKKTFDIINSFDNFIIDHISAIYGKSNNKYYNILRYIKLLFSISINLFLRIDRYDIIYVQYVWKHAFFVSFFLKKIKKYNKKLIINFHGEDLALYDQLSIREKKYFNKLCVGADAIFLPSLYFKKLLLKVDSSIENKIHIFPSGGVDSDIFFSKNIRSNSNVIVYCSRFDDNKGWDDFIKAATVINKTNIVSFVMVGYGKELESVRALIEKNFMTDKIRVYENLKQTEIAKIYSTADLFIFPTRLPESLGLVALEAMSCGLPVIASDIGAISEYVKPYVNGYLYEPGNVSQLVNFVNKFLAASEEEKSKFGEEAYKTAYAYRDSEVKNTFLNVINAL